MFQVGDKVRFLNEVGEATIIRLLPDNMVEIEDAYGLCTRLPKKELVPADRNRVSQPEPSPVIAEKVEEKAVIAATSDWKKNEDPLPELALVFVSDRLASPESGDLDLYFVNNSNHHMLVNIAAKEDKGLFSLFNGAVRAGQIQPVRPIRRQDVDIFGHTVVDCIFYHDADYRHREAFSAVLKIKVTRFVREGSYREVSALGGMAMVVAVERVSQPEVPAAGIAAQRVSRPVPKTPLLPIFEEEVDLHIEKLSGEFSSMTDHEIFTFQMSHFEKRLNHALTNNYLNITFIHGVGTGKLRDEIRKILRDYKLRFEDGPFQKYGVGATVVRLK